MQEQAEFPGVTTKRAAQSRGGDALQSYYLKLRAAALASCAPVRLSGRKRAIQAAPRLEHALPELDPAWRALGCQDLAHGRQI